jgi:hypothetical protein
MASPILQPATEPTDFVCPMPDCLAWNRFESTEPQQQCSTCKAFHDSEILKLDGWAL